MDDQFEEEIIRNVHLKSQVRESSKRVKVSREQKEEQELKEQEIQQMKRKAKGLKEKVCLPQCSFSPKTQKGLS